MGRRRAGRGRAFRGKAKARVRGDEERGCAAEHLDYARARRSAGGSLDFQIFVSARSNFFVHVVALFRLTFVTQERRFSDANRWNPPRHFLFWRPVALFLAPSCCRDAGGKSTSSRRRTRCRSAVETLVETSRRPPLPPRYSGPARQAESRRSGARRARAFRAAASRLERDSWRGVAHRRRGARAGVMASVEHYLTVLAGAQSAQNAEAQRAAAQMQIEVRLPRDRERQYAWSCARFVEARTRLATVPPPRRSIGDP